MLDRLKSAYDGYLFADKGERVYNPFSLINALDDLKIRNYWFTSGYARLSPQASGRAPL